MNFATLTASIFIATFALVFWIADGAPVPGVKVVPLKPNSSLPSFADVQRQVKEGKQDTASSYIPSTTNPAYLETDGDPKRTELRMSTLDAITTYRQDTCNAEKRKRLVAAIDDYMEGLRRSGANFKAEIDKFVISRIQDAGREGLVLSAELGMGGQVAMNGKVYDAPDMYYRCSVGRSG